MAGGGTAHPVRVRPARTGQLQDARHPAVHAPARRASRVLTRARAGRAWQTRAGAADPGHDGSRPAPASMAGAVNGHSGTRPARSADNHPERAVRAVLRPGVAVSLPRLVAVSVWPAGATAEYSAVQQEGQQYWRNTIEKLFDAAVPGDDIEAGVTGVAAAQRRGGSRVRRSPVPHDTNSPRQPERLSQAHGSMPARARSTPTRPARFPCSRSGHLA